MSPDIQILKSHNTRTHTHSDNDEKFEKQWHNLLRWLENKGMDPSGGLVVKPVARPDSGRGLVAVGDIPPSSTIIRIPPGALVNSRTLHPIYPFLPVEGISPTFDHLSNHVPLTGVQLLTIHFCLYRPDECEGSSDPHFGAYISLLPGDFDNHPLTWLIHERDGCATTEESRLLGALTPGARIQLDVVAKRFSSDIESITWYKHRYLDELNQIGPVNKMRLENLLWAWLIVNTRCMYLRLFAEDLPMSNLTLSPLVDFANHPPSGGLPVLQPPVSTKEVTPKKKSGDKKRNKFTFRSPEEMTPSGEEVYLKYGDHSNVTLFTEYGFVDSRGSHEGEVDLTDVVNELIRGSGEEWEHLAELVDEQGFSKNLRLYGTPSPAYPSWSVLVTLRMISDATADTMEGSCPSRDEDTASRWLKITSGEHDDGHEKTTRMLLANMCEGVISRGKEQIGVLWKELGDAETLSTSTWYHRSLWCIQRLWEEEVAVAGSVLRSIEEGIEF